MTEQSVPHSGLSGNFGHAWSNCIRRHSGGKNVLNSLLGSPEKQTANSNPLSRAWLSFSLETSHSSCRRPRRMQILFRFNGCGFLGVILYLSPLLGQGVDFRTG
jgi:hypothetical protein